MTLEILETIDGRSDVTQRHLAGRLGVALGLANSYLKRCVRKGLIKIEQAPANRYLYYLTPKGLAEKSRLTAEYLSSSFDFYRRAGDSLVRIFRICRARHKTHIVLYGITELAEIAILRAAEGGVHIAAIVDSTVKRESFHGVPVYTTLDQAGNFDVCLITDIRNPAELLTNLRKNVPAGKIFIPDILGVKNEHG